MDKVSKKIEWRHKDIWSHRGSDFYVEISRHTIFSHKEDDALGRGENRWCVYAYIYPEHKYFNKFSGESLSQPAANELPLHCGPSYIQLHRNHEGKVTSIQIGADYDHLYDGSYTHCSTKEEVPRVFKDAQELADWLENYKEEDLQQEA